MKRVSTKRRNYTCSYCRKKWPAHSTEKRHNQRTCPKLKEDLREEKLLQTAIELSLQPRHSTKIYKTCSICMDSNATYKTKCDHDFCKSCIKSWCNEFTNKTSYPTCPICKSVIDEDELKYIGAKQKPKKLLPSLPYGWKRVIASARTPFPGKIFYYNIHSRTSQWELPV